MNGDGIDDFLVGPATAQRFVRPTSGGAQGGVYVFYGSTRRHGDGLDDLLLGTNLPTSNNPGHSPRAYVLFGSRTDRDVINLSVTLEAEDGFEIKGPNKPTFGTNVVSPGDVNGDGLDDLLISHATESKVYLMYGMDEPTGSNTLDLSSGSLTANQGFVIHKTEGLAMPPPEQAMAMAWHSRINSVPLWTVSGMWPRTVMTTFWSEPHPSRRRRKFDWTSLSISRRKRVQLVDGGTGEDTPVLEGGCDSGTPWAKGRRGGGCRSHGPRRGPHPHRRPGYADAA